MITKIIIFILKKILAPSIEGYILITLLLTFGMKKRFNFKYFNVLMIIELLLIYEFSYSATYPNKSLLQLVLSTMLILLIIQINFVGKIYKKIISFALFIGILIVSEAILFLLLSIIGVNPSFIFTSDIYYSYAVILTIIIKLVIVKLIKIKLLKTKINFPRGYLLHIILLIVFALVYCYAIIELYLMNSIDKEYINSIMPIIVFTSIILIPSIVIFISTRIIIHTKYQVEREQLLEQYQLEYKYSKELNKILDNLRILKHDLKNHISCMWGLVETDNIEDFKIYLNNLTKELEEVNYNEIACNIGDTKYMNED